MGPQQSEDDNTLTNVTEPHAHPQPKLNHPESIAAAEIAAAGVICSCKFRLRHTEADFRLLRGKEMWKWEDR